MAVDRLSFFFYGMRANVNFPASSSGQSFVHVFFALLNVKKLDISMVVSMFVFVALSFFLGGGRVEDTMDALLY